MLRPPSAIPHAVIPAIDVDTASTLASRWLDEAAEVEAVRQLNGGMVHAVYEWAFADRRPPAVVKINAAEHLAHFEAEREALAWYRAHTELPVPEPIGCFVDESTGVAALLMRKIEGPNLAEARLTPRGVKMLQQELAGHVAALHTHTSETFGPVAGAEPAARFQRWVDVFQPMFEREVHAVRDQLSSRSRRIVEAVGERLKSLLGASPPPTLVHGDLWATNILVDDANPARPRIAAFIDPAPAYADPEYELAYLRLFHTADEHFFRAYFARHAMRDGFEQRCRVYWLCTMLLHVRRHGERYLGPCEDLAAQLRRLV